MNEVKNYQYGNTVRLQCEFSDHDGNFINPEVIKITIYNNKKEEILTKVLDSTNSISVGKYYFDYTTENKEQKIYYEWYGEIDGSPALKRGIFVTLFV